MEILGRGEVVGKGRRRMKINKVSKVRLYSNGVYSRVELGAGVHCLASQKGYEESPLLFFYFF